MQPLNPFLRALFRSTALGQAIPIQNHVLLVPTTDSLLNATDGESRRPYTEVVRDEEFLGSHILRVTSSNGFGGKDDNNIRENRGKAKSYTTVNGRTVIIKENMVYSNKGTTSFKNLSQAHLLSDVIYFSAHDAQNWLIYYISRPLVGTFEATPIVPAVISRHVSKENPSAGTSQDSPMPKKKEIKSFSDLLNNFPMIARQMQPGLERLFNEFGKELGKPLPPPPSTSSSLSNLVAEYPAIKPPTHHGKANGHAKLPFNSNEFFDDEEDLMRRALETAVTAAIDLFQLVDKQQLSFLGATTELTGPVVERLIERYVAEQVHDNLLFPRICSFHRGEDQELARRIRQMENIDVSQVGIAMDGGKVGKEELVRRVNKGVEAFRRMGVACSPQEMLEVLLDTEKAVTEEAVADKTSSAVIAEKQSSAMTINADILVSLLLIVVIRSQIRHLQARLSYMQRFIYIDDVESGEVGYALSTFEAVQSYLMKDAGGLRKASMRNRRLWNATKSGNLSDMKAILEFDDTSTDDKLVDEPQEFGDHLQLDSVNGDASESAQDFTITRSCSSSNVSPKASTSFESNLSHVFPFQASSVATSVSATVKTGKKVSMDIRSLSSSSAYSVTSRTTTIGSTTSGVEGDTSIESLSRTQDLTGNSVPMMAVEAGQPDSLRYLLSLEEYYPPQIILDDTTSEGTTLLSAAIQLAHTELIDVILDYVFERREEQSIVDYIAKADSRGRTAAHYLFNAPQLLSRLSSKLPWRKKDRIGQTPLFALCRSYDHPDYGAMVSEGLTVASEAQGDGLPLRLSDHTDNKGNTLLHIVNDPAIIHRILHHCDADPNATNDKRFTPLMLASKYGRLDLVRVFFGDPRVDFNLKELRGLTAVELAKDDEVRNRIDDLALISNSSPAPGSMQSGRITTIVRSFFVEDGTTRFILKSGAPSNTSDPNGTTFTITTSRRTLTDFENLARWLASEHPASYLPNISSFRSPFQVISKPSRAVLHDIQVTLDRFLKILLAHPTFSTHEMLWEFFLVPDMQSEQMAQRAKLKAELLKETIQDEYEPVTDIQDVQQNTAHSQRMIQGVASRTRLLIRRGNFFQLAQNDLTEALNICTAAFSTLGPPADALPEAYVIALMRYASFMATPANSLPLKGFIESITGFSSTISALQTSFMRPTALISQLTATTRSVERHRANLTSQSLPRKFNFPGMEESRFRSMKDTEAKIGQGEREVERLSRELRWTSEVVVGELAGWTAWRETVGREAVKRFARDMVVKEKERGKRLERCLRALREAKKDDGSNLS